MHGEIVSFYVERDGEHVVLTVTAPTESGTVTVRTTKDSLRDMSYADVRYDEGVPQSGTPRGC